MYQPIAHSQTDFYNNLWAPAHLLTKGESPYNTASLHPGLPALWMPTAVIFFSFLGFFSFDAAQQIWFLLNIMGLAALLYLSIPNTRTFPVLLAGAFLAYFFPPTINHFALGQVSILSALCLFGATKLIKKMPWGSAFLLSLGMTKPQIGIFILFGIIIHQFQHDDIKALFSYLSKVFITTLALILPLFIVTPNWIPDFITSLQSNTSKWTHPSILSQLRIWTGNWSYFLWGLLLISLLWLIVKMWGTYQLHAALLWTLAITVLITPYVWSWDFVFLLPLFVYIFSVANWKGRVILLIGYCIIWGSIAIIQTSENFHNSRFWWVPLALITISAMPYFSPNIKKKETIGY